MPMGVGAWLSSVFSVLRCRTRGCGVQGRQCNHTRVLCLNCGEEGHFAGDRACPERLSTKAATGSRVGWDEWKANPITRGKGKERAAGGPVEGTEPTVPEKQPMTNRAVPKEREIIIIPPSQDGSEDN
jgi:hypothetical protein